MKGDLYKNLGLLVAACPICNESFQGSQIRLIEETADERQILHVDCEHCLSSLVMLFYEEFGQVKTRGLVTDLTYPEVMKYYNSSSLTLDDVINVHDALETFVV